MKNEPLNYILELFLKCCGNTPTQYRCRPIVEPALAQATLDCIFCNGIKENDFFLENDFAIARYDKHPVTKLHTLIIPKRHFSDFFEITKVEHQAILELLLAVKKSLLKKDKEITGFNLGVNAGQAAGQTVMHCHIHLIPRREGDIDDPRGGVRGVIPEKRIY